MSTENHLKKEKRKQQRPKQEEQLLRAASVIIQNVIITKTRSLKKALQLPRKPFFFFFYFYKKIEPLSYLHLLIAQKSGFFITCQTETCRCRPLKQKCICFYLNFQEIRKKKHIITTTTTSLKSSIHINQNYLPFSPKRATAPIHFFFFFFLSSTLSILLEIDEDNYFAMEFLAGEGSIQLYFPFFSSRQKPNK